MSEAERSLVVQPEPPPRPHSAGGTRSGSSLATRSGGAQSQGMGAGSSSNALQRSESAGLSLADAKGPRGSLSNLFDDMFGKMQHAREFSETASASPLCPLRLCLRLACISRAQNRRSEAVHIVSIRFSAYRAPALKLLR